MPVAPRSAPTLVDALGAATLDAAETVAPALLAERYELLGLVGTGGMGSVYRALDHELGEVVALKLLRPELLGSPEMLEMFRNEVRLARRVTHPNVARTYDIGQRREDRFITMEYVQGQPLSALVEGRRPVPLARAVPIMRGVCRGLGAAHAVGVVHRDLKPENVLLGVDGRVVVSDFGIACVYAADARRSHARVVGTPSYMAPEQVQARADIDHRADIYAFGALLYELLCGQPPWTTPDLLARLRSLPPHPRTLRAGVPDRAAELALACLEPDPQRRPASARVLEDALDALATDDGTGLELPLPGAPAVPLAVTRLGSFSQATPPRHKTVAVVPFRCRGLPEDVELVDGLAAELVDALSGVAALRVRPSSMSSELREASFEQLRATLAVQVLVQGSVERRGDRFCLAVRLVTTDDGFQLWARRFECPLTGLLTVIGTAAAEIAARLTVELQTPGLSAPSVPEAMELYLRGRAALRDVWPARNAVAVELLGRAHALAPDDPTISAALARACTRRWFWTGTAADAARASAVLARASELAPDSAEVALAAAGMRFMVNDHEAAVRHLGVALGRSPSFAEARELLGRVALELGRLEFGLRHLRAAGQLDPRWAQPVETARALALLGRWPEAAELVERWTPEPEEISAKAIVCARLALWAPDPAPFIAAEPPFAAVTEPGRGYVELARTLRGSTAGLDPEQRAILTRYLAATEQSLRFHVLLHQLAAEAHLYAVVRAGGEAAGARGPDPLALAMALEHVVVAVTAGLADLGWLDRCPLLAPLRGRPDFAPLRERVAARNAGANQALDGAA